VQRRIPGAVSAGVEKYATFWWGAQGEMNALATLLSLDERYYQALHSSDFDTQRYIADIHIELEIEYLRIHYPDIMEKLEAVYREAST
jgi:hypothetical protein